MTPLAAGGRQRGLIIERVMVEGGSFSLHFCRLRGTAAACGRDEVRRVREAVQLGLLLRRRLQCQLAERVDDGERPHAVLLHCCSRCQVALAVAVAADLSVFSLKPHHAIGRTIAIVRHETSSVMPPASANKDRKEGGVVNLIENYLPFCSTTPFLILSTFIWGFRHHEYLLLLCQFCLLLPKQNPAQGAEQQK